MEAQRDINVTIIDVYLFFSCVWCVCYGVEQTSSDNFLKQVISIITTTTTKNRMMEILLF